MAVAVGLGQAVTVRTLADRLRVLPRALEESLLRAVGRAQEAGQETAIDELRQQGIARSIWGWQPKSARKRGRKPQVWTPKPKVHQGKIEAVLAAYGLAAYVELGGRTKPHVILGKGRNTLGDVRRGRRGGVLSFVSAGRRMFATYVKHPGGPIPKRPYLHVGIAAMQEKFQAAAEQEMQFALDHVVK
jgi:hypothetical protein